VMWPTLSSQRQYVTDEEKLYDWIMVSSLNPRKRIARFLQALSDAGLAHLRGCVVTRTPHREHFKQELEVINKEIEKGINVEIKTDLNCQEKMQALCRARVFVSAAEEDSGPRSIIEAGQAEIPVLALSHHGAASILVSPGKNGELVNHFRQFPRTLNKILSNYSKYDCDTNHLLLDENLWFPNVVAALNARNILNNKK